MHDEIMYFVLHDCSLSSDKNMSSEVSILCYVTGPFCQTKQDLVTQPVPFVRRKKKSCHVWCNDIITYYRTKTLLHLTKSLCFVRRNTNLLTVMYVENGYDLHNKVIWSYKMCIHLVLCNTKSSVSYYVTTNTFCLTKQDFMCVYA